MRQNLIDHQATSHAEDQATNRLLGQASEEAVVLLESSVPAQGRGLSRIDAVPLLQIIRCQPGSVQVQ